MLALLVLLAQPVAPLRPAETSWVERLLSAATSQVGKTVRYDGTYRRLAYPGGDVPLETGVCTDVVIRAYRALGIDLQELVHADMRRAFGAYPGLWGATRPDPNIDHRRVPNLRTFLKRHGTVLPVTKRATDYRPGDIVTWRLPRNLPHIGLVTAEIRDGRPLVVHNIGAGAQVEDMLFAYEITGRYRYAPKR